MVADRCVYSVSVYGSSSETMQSWRLSRVQLELRSCPNGRDMVELNKGHPENGYIN